MTVHKLTEIAKVHHEFFNLVIFKLTFFFGLRNSVQMVSYPETSANRIDTRGAALVEASEEPSLEMRPLLSVQQI